MPLGRRSTRPSATSRSTRLVTAPLVTTVCSDRSDGREGAVAALAPQGREHVELALAEPELGVDADELGRQRGGHAVQPADDEEGRRVEVGALGAPLLDDLRGAVGGARGCRAWVEYTFPGRYYVFRGNYLVDTKLGGLALVAVTAIAPVVWGSTYAVTHLFLPADRPLFAGVDADPARRAAHARVAPAPARAARGGGAPSSSAR